MQVPVRLDAQQGRVLIEIGKVVTRIEIMRLLLLLPMHLGCTSIALVLMSMVYSLFKLDPAVATCMWTRFIQVYKYLGVT